MKILYCGLLYNYGKKEEGFSYEHNNVEAGIRDCVTKGMFDADYWYPDNATKEDHDKLIDLISLNHYDAIFHVAFNEHLDLPESAASLALKKDIPVIQWDCDASWRFNNWIINRKNRVGYFVTTHSKTVDWYLHNDMKVIKSQWGGSPLYEYKKCEKKYDVSFIGQKHGIRPQILETFYKAGIKVDLFGSYWEGYPNWNGYIKDFDGLLSVFNESKICLNLSNPWHVNTMPQIKGRHFEIPQCGAFQISTPADDLESYFINNKEICIVNNMDEFIDKTRYYLANDDERERIAANGFHRMHAEHQWSNRLKNIFEEVFK